MELWGPYTWPYKWITAVITPPSGVLTPFITSRGGHLVSFTLEKWDGNLGKHRTFSNPLIIRVGRGILLPPKFNMEPENSTWNRRFVLESITFWLPAVKLGGIYFINLISHKPPFFQLP